MQSPRWFLAGLLCTGVLLAAAGAHGQTSAAAADALFEKAVGLMKSNKYAEACPALAESQRLDPRPGTLFTLADCESEAGKIASAVAHYKEYLRIYATMEGQLRKRHAERARIAGLQVQNLEPDVPTLKFTYAGTPPLGLRVTQDGVDIGIASLETVLPVDPGEHVFVTKVPGRPDVEQRVKIERKDKAVVDLSFAPKSVGSGMPPDGGPKGPEQPADGGSSSNTRNRIGIVLIGVGAAGLVFGGVMGGLALAGKSTVEAHCNGLQCDATGYDAVGQSRTFGLASTVGFAAGGGIAGAGAILFFTSLGSKPKSGGVTAHVGADIGPGGAFLSLRGDF